VYSLTCKIEGQDHCPVWGCNQTVTAVATCTTVGITAAATCTKIYQHDASSTPWTYETSTGCSTRTSTLNECLFTSGTDAECTEYCTSDNCNNIYTVETSSSTTATAINCVQCRSEDATSGNCYSNPPDAIACPSADYQYCTTMHTVALDSNGAVAHEVVFRGCSKSEHNDGCSVETLQVDGNSSTLATSVTCTKTCSTADCNNDTLPLSGVKGSGLSCQTCSAGSGGCGGVYNSRQCTSDQSYCYSKVIYTEGDSYYENLDPSDSVAIVYEERGCRNASVTSQCTTVSNNIANSNIQTVKCEETCDTDNCNTQWPNRPTCSQCAGSYYDSSGNLLSDTSSSHYDWCRKDPPMPQMCADPSYKYCYAYEKYQSDDDNEVKWGYSKEFRRGCLKEKEWSKCKSSKFEDKRKAVYCQFVCDKDDCNLGSDVTKLMAPLRLILMTVFISAVWKNF